MLAKSSLEFDILVVGAGVLGVTIAYWLSSLYECDIAIVDLETLAGMHATSRNTGVLHRPFYLDPSKKRIFAHASNASYPMWKQLAFDAGLPWKPVGTLNVAVEEREISTLSRYVSWGPRNGMEEKELELLDAKAAKAIEPELECMRALQSKRDVSVDFGAFTRHLCRVLVGRGVRFLGGSRVVSVRIGGGGHTEVGIQGEGFSSIRCKFMLNAAGGGALEVAHKEGIALSYASLNFRGEYWVVDEPFASKVSSNIYRPPRYPEFPFLDPHFVVRASGVRQIGPNAVLVPGPYVYRGVGIRRIMSLLDEPIEPKARLVTNGTFLSLVASEWTSSLSKRVMSGRVRKFVPRLDARLLNRRSVFGVRSSLIDSTGFVPEAVLIKGQRSAHILNYNSPGASGAPAYSAMVVGDLRNEGFLDEFKIRAAPLFIQGWKFGLESELLLPTG